MILRGIDTLEFGLDIDNYLDELAYYLGQFKELKEKGHAQGKACNIGIGGINFTVELSGAPFYKYKLSCNDFFLYFMDRVMPNNSPVKVKFLSCYLWSFSYKDAYKRFFEWFEGYLCKIEKSRTSRLDICCDTDIIQFKESDINSFVTRAQSKSKEFVDSINYQGKEFSGFTIGRGDPILCRIYNKSLEIKKSQKNWFNFIWINNGCTLNNDVWRIEFQLRRSLLKEVKINSVEDVFEKEDSLWTYLTKKWLVYKVPNEDNNVSRWAIHQTWYDIQNKVSKLYVPPLTREKIKLGNLEMLMDQASGLLITIGALKNTDLDNSLRDLGNHCEKKLNNKNSSFQNEIEKRKNKYC